MNGLWLITYGYLPIDDSLELCMAEVDEHHPAGGSVRTQTGQK